MNEAEQFFDDVRRRLVAMVDTPNWEYLRTPRRRRKAHEKRLRTFIGYSEDEVRRAEERLGVVFPTVYRTYLLTMGKAHGDLFCGSDVATIDQYEAYRAEAYEIAEDCEPPLELPGRAVVFLQQQGFTFSYFEANGGFDAPIHTYSESGPQGSCDGFEEFIEGILRVKENTYRHSLKSGGHYLELHEGGGATRYIGKKWRPLRTNLAMDLIGGLIVMVLGVGLTIASFFIEGWSRFFPVFCGVILGGMVPIAFGLARFFRVRRIVRGERDNTL